jgi:pSer/pThr/pTyr-binding forkhead associated (FHA) protein
MMAEFIVQDLNGTRRVPIGRQMTIGRGSDNDLVLHGTFVSRRHAWVWQQGDRVVVEDLASVNGTFVNGQRLTRARFLRPNDLVAMGEVHLTFLARQDPSDDQTPRSGTPYRTIKRTAPPHSFTPTDPVVARPFPRTESATRRGRGTQACLLLLLLAIVAVILLMIVGVLVLYTLGLG